jgi:hypothetical protein
MGGNAFPGKTGRLSADKYFELADDLKYKFAEISEDFRIIPAYRKKESFGDMDILLIPSRELSFALLKEIFQTDDVLRNGGVYSLVVKGFQIDLIITPREEFEYALAYFSWNDFGNLCGKIAHKFGLKHGHDGLKYVVRSRDHILGEVILTRDPKKALRFLDIDPGDGFDTLEEMFECICRSKYMSKEMFSFENMNHIARIRDRKRSTYNSFLKYIETRDDLPSFPFEKDKSAYLPMIYEAFPHARDEVIVLIERAALQMRVHEKLNGVRVRELTGRDGKELGALMKDLKTKLSPEEIDGMSQEAIDTLTMAWHHHLRTKETYE